MYRPGRGGLTSVLRVCHQKGCKVIKRLLAVGCSMLLTKTSGGFCDLERK